MAEDQNPQEPKFTPPDLDTLKKDSQSIFENLNDISKLITDSAKELSKATGDSAASYKSSFAGAIKLSDKLRSYSKEDLKDSNIAATLLKVQERKTAKGSSYAVLKLTDLNSVFELFIFSELLDSNREIL